VNFRKGWYFTSLVCAVTIIIELVTFILARTKIRQIIPTLIIAVSYVLMCVLITWTGEAEGANFLFIYFGPPLAIMMLGMGYGITFSLILIALISVEMFFPGLLKKIIPGLAPFDYHLDFSIRMLVNYFILLAVMIVVETTRKTKDRIVDAQRKILEKQAEELTAANKRLKELSRTDQLTKIHNRHSFSSHIGIIWKQSRRLHLPITVIMIDIDYFKKYNDSLGHIEGDKTLIAIAQCMKNRLKRDTDFLARFGGEEFVCLLPYAEKADAENFANELVQSVENLKIPHPACEHSKYVTISAGVASMMPDVRNSYIQLLNEADRALYMAKQSGRNRAVMI